MRALCQERDVFVTSARTISYISHVKITEFVGRTWAVEFSWTKRKPAVSNWPRFFQSTNIIKLVNVFEIGKIKPYKEC